MDRSIDRSIDSSNALKTHPSQGTYDDCDSLYSTMDSPRYWRSEDKKKTLKAFVSFTGSHVEGHITTLPLCHWCTHARTHAHMRVGRDGTDIASDCGTKKRFLLVPAFAVFFFFLPLLKFLSPSPATLEMKLAHRSCSPRNSPGIGVILSFCLSSPIYFPTTYWSLIQVSYFICVRLGYNTMSDNLHLPPVWAHVRTESSIHIEETKLKVLEIPLKVPSTTPL